MSNDTPNRPDADFPTTEAVEELDRRAAVRGIETILAADELAMLSNPSFTHAVQRKLADKAANAWWERAQGEGDEWPELDLAAVFEAGIEVPNPTIIERSDGRCLLYAGLANSLFGEAGSGKTAFCQSAAAEEIRAGHDVYVVDFETNAVVWLARLRALGLSQEAIVKHFIYLDTSKGARPPVPREGARVVVLDSLTGALDAFGFEPNDVSGIQSVYRQVVDPFTDAGLAALVIDHVGHADKSRPMNSIRKTGIVQGAMYRMEVIPGMQFGRDRTGEALLFLHKDNMGGVNAVKNEIVAKFVMSSTDNGSAVQCRIVPGNDMQTALSIGRGQLSIVDQKKVAILNVLADREWHNKTPIREAVGGKPVHIDTALEELEREGIVTHETKGRSELYRLVEQ
jgi:DNA-binding transcriptional ArsR family regulator